MEAYIYKSDVYTVEASENCILIAEKGDCLAELVPSTRVFGVAVAEEDILDDKGNIKVKKGDYYDVEETDERIVSFSAASDSKFIWEAESSLWKKTYTLDCSPEGFSYFVTLHGTGNVGKVQYFRNDKTGSLYEFCEYFFPCPASHPELKMRRSSAEEYLTFFELFIPPAYVYSFRTEEHEGRFGLGLVAEEGKHNFIHYDYRKCCPEGLHRFFFETDLEGHTEVDGDFTLPFIRSFFAPDDLAIIKSYSDYYYENGFARKKLRRDEDVPRWWRGPIVCGWNEQGAQCDLFYHDCGQKDLANQEIYEKIADMIDEYGVKATMLIIDDKWQKGYGDATPDPKKWPDMRAFVDKMHARGLRVLLWFRMWGGEGLPENEVMYGEGMPYNNRRVRLDYPPYCDPTNPAYEKHLREMVHNLLSPDEGCMNADGFKLDYTLVQPYGESAKSYGGQYGAEATKMLYNIIYSAAKEAKPDALINGSPCHPYFDEVCDMARAHDYSWGLRNETESMSERADLFSTVMENVLIDTDSPNAGCQRDSMRYFRNQPKIGIPDVYQFSNNYGINYTDKEWDEIRGILNKYVEDTDKKYGPVEPAK